MQRYKRSIDRPAPACFRGATTRSRKAVRNRRDRRPARSDRHYGVRFVELDEL